MQPAQQRSEFSSPAPGDVVFGCFRLLDTLGMGSFATAYLAEQEGTDRLAVVKIPHAHLLGGPNGNELRRRFEAEARASTRIVHPNMVTVYLVGNTHYGLPAIAMEYVPGETLASRLTRGAPLPFDELADLGAQIADVLATLHEADIVHRDLSPHNVLVQVRTNNRLWVKVLDLGVAKLLDAPSHTVCPMGTPGYLAPEQLLGIVTPLADVFSLGAVLWWAITGSERPDDFHDGTLREIIGRTVGPDPRTIRPDAPAGFAELIARALIPEPRERPSMTEFLARWRDVADAHPERTTLSGGLPRVRPAVVDMPTLPSVAGSATPVGVDVPDPVCAVVISNPALRAQVLHHLHGRVTVEQPATRELGRAAPGRYAVAILDELLDRIGTREVVGHLRECYPELSVVVVGRDAAWRGEWLAVGVEAFFAIPHELPDLALWCEGAMQATTGACAGGARAGPPSTDEPKSRLRRSLIAALRQSNPQQLARALEAFIGSVPQWFAEIARTLDEPSEHARSTCQRLIRGAEAVGADGLARFTRAACQSLTSGDVSTARTFLAAAEREYREVFRETFPLMNELQTQ